MSNIAGSGDGGVATPWTPVGSPTGGDRAQNPKTPDAHVNKYQAKLVAAHGVGDAAALTLRDMTTIQSTIAVQKRRLAVEKRENQRLREELYGLGNEPGVVQMTGQGGGLLKAEKKSRDRADELKDEIRRMSAQMLGATSKLEDINRAIGRTESKISKLKSSEGKQAAFKKGSLNIRQERKLEKVSDFLEQQVITAKQRVGATIAENMQMRRDIDDLRKEKREFMNKKKSVEESTKTLDLLVKQHQSQAKELLAERDAIMGQVNEVKEEQESEHTIWAEEIKSLGHEMDELDSTMKKLDEDYMKPDPVMNKSLARVMRAKTRAMMLLAQKDAATLQQAYDAVMVELGFESVEDLISRFSAQEDSNFRRFQYLEVLNGEIDMLRKEVVEMQTEAETLEKSRSEKSEYWKEVSTEIEHNVRSVVQQTETLRRKNLKTESTMALITNTMVNVARHFKVAVPPSGPDADPLARFNRLFSSLALVEDKIQSILAVAFTRPSLRAKLQHPPSSSHGVNAISKESEVGASQLQHGRSRPGSASKGKRPGSTGKGRPASASRSRPGSSAGSVSSRGRSARKAVDLTLSPGMEYDHTNDSTMQDLTSDSETASGSDMEHHQSRSNSRAGRSSSRGSARSNSAAARKKVTLKAAGKTTLVVMRMRRAEQSKEEKKRQSAFAWRRKVSQVELGKCVPNVRPPSLPEDSSSDEDGTVSARNARITSLFSSQFQANESLDIRKSVDTSAISMKDNALVLDSGAPSRRNKQSRLQRLTSGVEPKLPFAPSAHPGLYSVMQRSLSNLSSLINPGSKGSPPVISQQKKRAHIGRSSLEVVHELNKRSSHNRVSSSSRPSTARSSRPASAKSCTSTKSSRSTSTVASLAPAPESKGGPQSARPRPDLKRVTYTHNLSPRVSAAEPGAVNNRPNAVTKKQEPENIRKIVQKRKQTRDKQINSVYGAQSMYVQ